MNADIRISDQYTYHRDMSETCPWFERQLPDMDEPQRLVIRENVGIIHMMAMEIATLRADLADARDDYNAAIEERNYFADIVNGLPAEVTATLTDSESQPNQFSEPAVDDSDDDEPAEDDTKLDEIINELEAQRDFTDVEPLTSDADVLGLPE